MLGIDFTEALNWAIPVGFLLLIDFLLGVAAAALAGTLKASWLYIFGRTKGVAYVMGVALLVVGAVAPDMSQLGDTVPEEFFSAFGLSFLAPLGVSLVASIVGNVNSLRSGGDPTAPTGAGARPNEPVPAEPVDPIIPE